MTIGIVVGTAAGAAIVESVSRRAPVSGKVRVDGTGRRPMADDSFATDVLPAVAAVAAVEAISTHDAVPVSGGADPMMTAILASGPAPAMAPRSETIRAPEAVAMVLAFSGGSSGAPESRNGSGATTAHVDEPDLSAGAGPCAEARRLADERCELAARAREAAAAVEASLRAAQRTHGEHEAGATAASVAADARAVRDAKDAAQARFGEDRAAAGTTEEVDAAARAWLLEINAINQASRDAVTALTRERESANAIATQLERLSLDADAARIAAGTAEAACLAAREALADCEEREAAGPRGHMPVLPESDHVNDVALGVGSSAVALGTTGSPRIFRLLRGDRTAMTEMVAALGGDDAGDRRRWQLAIADLVDAIVSDSIAASALEFPADHHFWGPFTREQNREIAGALSSLGYRFDGLGGWVDLRVPSQRDLSLAMGYAGIDPMRLRNWPTATQMTELYRDVEVAAAEHLSGAAGDLTLGELVSMLGRRADGLAEVWNHWGHIRPLLLEDA